MTLIIPVRLYLNRRRRRSRVAKRPVKGLTSSEIAEIQKKMIGFNNLVNPAYFPKLYIEEVDGKQILILWV